MDIATSRPAPPDIVALLEAAMGRAHGIVEHSNRGNEGGIPTTTADDGVVMASNLCKETLRIRSPGSHASSMDTCCGPSSDQTTPRVNDYGDMEVQVILATTGETVYTSVYSEVNDLRVWELRLHICHALDSVEYFSFMLFPRFGSSG